MAQKYVQQSRATFHTLLPALKVELKRANVARITSTSTFCTNLLHVFPRLYYIVLISY